MLHIVLNPGDAERLRRPVEGQGGLQSLLRRLKASIGDDGSLSLTEEEVERIRRYVSRYGQGGFQDRLKPLIQAIDTAVPEKTGKSLDQF